MIDIVIINWNSGDFLKKCIDSIFKDKNDSLIQKVIVIDNNSIDNSAKIITINQKIEFIQNIENLGFAKACNQGFKLCKSPFVLLLNPDTILFETTLSDCAAFMTKNESVDILGCSLLDDTGKLTKSCSRFPTALRFLYDATGLSKIAPKIFNPATIMTDWNHEESRFVDQVMGAFMFLRRSIFDKIGFFDEDFFVYYEELDFSLRLAKAGGRTFYNTTINAIHSGEGTTKSVKAFRLFLNLQSRLKYSRKHFSRGGNILVYFSTYFIEFFFRLIFLILSGRLNEIKDLVKAYQILLQS